jgi:hypothetical protein
VDRHLWTEQGFPWPTDGERFASFLRHLRLAGLPLFAGGVVAFYWILRKRPATAIELSAVALAIGFSALAAVVVPDVDAPRSRRAFAEVVARDTAGAPLAIYGTGDDALTYYLGRAPESVAVDDAQLAAFLTGEGPRYAVIRAADFDALAQKADYMIVASSTHGTRPSYHLIRRATALGAGSK